MAAAGVNGSGRSRWQRPEPAAGAEGGGARRPADSRSRDPAATGREPTDTSAATMRARAGERRAEPATDTRMAATMRARAGEQQAEPATGTRMAATIGRADSRGRTRQPRRRRHPNGPIPTSAHPATTRNRRHSTADIQAARSPPAETNAHARGVTGIPPRTPGRPESHERTDRRKWDPAATSGSRPPRQQWTRESLRRPTEADLRKTGGLRRSAAYGDRRQRTDPAAAANRAAPTDSRATGPTGSSVSAPAGQPGQPAVAGASGGDQRPRWRRASAMPLAARAENA